MLLTERPSCTPKLLFSRGEKDSNVARSLCEVLKKTGASTEITVSTMFAAIKSNLGGGGMDDLEIIKLEGRAHADCLVDSNISYYLDR